MLEIAIPELKLMLVWHEIGLVQCKKINDIDSSYEFKAKDHKFIERNSYHFIKPLWSQKTNFEHSSQGNHLSFTRRKYCLSH